MPDAIPACFRAAAAPGARGSSAAASASSGSGSASGAGTSLATSVYDTRLGLATLSWSRAALGLSLRAVLRVSPAAAPPPSSASDYGDGEAEEEYDGGDDEEEVAVRVRPWLLWRRRGCKRFRVRGRRVDLAWDLSRARFPPSGSSPEPSSGYFVAVVVDGEMAVVAGDMADEAYRRTRARRPPGPGPVLVSRREHVSMRDGRAHRTCVVVRGKEREISVDLVSRAAKAQAQGQQKDRDSSRAEVGMSVSVDGDRVLHVRRLRWKFRGTEKVDLGGGDRVLVSWDLHNWLFPGRDTSPPDAAAAAALAAAAAPPAHAVFVFRFELADAAGGRDGEEDRDPADAKEKERLDKAGRAGGGGWAGYVGRWGRGDWSESSSNGEKRRKRGQASRLAKANSSSSASVASSSASWASGSTVMDWGSPEEAELQSGTGFSLLVYAWKN